MADEYGVQMVHLLGRIHHPRVLPPNGDPVGRTGYTPVGPDWPPRCPVDDYYNVPDEDPDDGEDEPEEEY